MAIPSGLVGPAIADVLIAAHRDRGRVPLQLGGLRTSWVVSDAGDLSGFAALADVWRIVTDPADLRGRWLTWEHPTLGPWGGRIADVAMRAQGVIEVSASGWLSLLDKRLTQRRDVAILAHAGAIAARLVRDAGAVEPTGIASVSAHEYGDMVAWRDDGSEVLSALPRLARMSDQEYGVDEATRQFRWRHRYGTDNRASVMLVQGMHIADWRPAWSLGPIVTEVVLTPSGRERFVRPLSVSGRDAAAYGAFGPRQARGTVRGRLARSSVQAIAQRQAERLARLGRLIELDIVDHNACWSWLRKGDTVTVLLDQLPEALAVRCLALSWDQDANLLRVSGEIQ